MKRFTALTVCVLWLSTVFAQAADWLSDGYDTKRTNWQRDEKLLTPDNVKGMKLLWKIKLDNKPRQMHNLLEPLVIGRVETKSGPKQLVIQAGVSDNVYAIDASNGQIVWKRQFESSYQDPPSGRGPSVLPRRHDR
jgi:glucose dehydrogenase